MYDERFHVPNVHTADPSDDPCQQTIKINSTFHVRQRNVHGSEDCSLEPK